MPSEYHFTNCGCIYIAFGFEYLMLAAYSASTLKLHNPRLQTTVITNVPLKSVSDGNTPLFDHIVYRDRPSATNREEKISANLSSRYAKTLLLDCDTEIRGDLSPIFRLLDDYDIAVRLHNRVTKDSFQVIDGFMAHELGLADWNAGVIFFRNTEKTKELFNKWREIFRREGMSQDQPAFMRAILSTRKLCLLPLCIVWNIKPTSFEFKLVESGSPDVRIFHYREPFNRPELARAIYRTYKRLDIRYSLKSDVAKINSLEEERRRFNILYYYYSVFLIPFNNGPGRLFLRKHGKFVRKFFFVAYLRLRAFFTADAPIWPGRSSQVVGNKFPRRTNS